MNERWHIGWLEQIVVHLTANCLQCGIEIGIAGENECCRFRLHTTHGAHHGKAVAGLSNVEVRKQHLKSGMIDQFQSFRNGGWRRHLKSMLLQDWLQGFGYPRPSTTQKKPGATF